MADPSLAPTAISYSNQAQETMPSLSDGSFEDDTYEDHEVPIDADTESATRARQDALSTQPQYRAKVNGGAGWMDGVRRRGVRAGEEEEEEEMYENGEESNGQREAGLSNIIPSHQSTLDRPSTSKPESIHLGHIQSHPNDTRDEDHDDDDEDSFSQSLKQQPCNPSTSTSKPNPPPYTALSTADGEDDDQDHNYEEEEGQDLPETITRVGASLSANARLLRQNRRISPGMGMGMGPRPGGGYGGMSSLGRGNGIPEEADEEEEEGGQSAGAGQGGEEGGAQGGHPEASQFQETPPTVAQHQPVARGGFNGLMTTPGRSRTHSESVPISYPDGNDEVGHGGSTSPSQGARTRPSLHKPGRSGRSERDSQGNGAGAGGQMRYLRGNAESDEEGNEGSEEDEEDDDEDELEEEGENGNGQAGEERKDREHSYVTDSEPGRLAEEQMGSQFSDGEDEFGIGHGRGRAGSGVPFVMSSGMSSAPAHGSASNHTNGGRNGLLVPPSSSPSGSQARGSNLPRHSPKKPAPTTNGPNVLVPSSAPPPPSALPSSSAEENIDPSPPGPLGAAPPLPINANTNGNKDHHGPLRHFSPDKLKAAAQGRGPTPVTDPATSQGLRSNSNGGAARGTSDSRALTTVELRNPMMQSRGGRALGATGSGRGSRQFSAEPGHRGEHDEPSSGDSMFNKFEHRDLSKKREAQRIRATMDGITARGGESSGSSAPQPEPVQAPARKGSGRKGLGSGSRSRGRGELTHVDDTHMEVDEDHRVPAVSASSPMEPTQVDGGKAQQPGGTQVEDSHPEEEDEDELDDDEGAAASGGATSQLASDSQRLSERQEPPHSDPVSVSEPQRPEMLNRAPLLNGSFGRPQAQSTPARQQRSKRGQADDAESENDELVLLSSTSHAITPASVDSAVPGVVIDTQTTTDSISELNQAGPSAAAAEVEEEEPARMEVDEPVRHPANNERPSLVCNTRVAQPQEAPTSAAGSTSTSSRRNLPAHRSLRRTVEPGSNGTGSAMFTSRERIEIGPPAKPANDDGSLQEETLENTLRDRENQAAAAAAAAADVTVPGIMVGDVDDGPTEPTGDVLNEAMDFEDDDEPAQPRGRKRKPSAKAVEAQDAASERSGRQKSNRLVTPPTNDEAASFKEKVVTPDPAHNKKKYGKRKAGLESPSARRSSTRSKLQESDGDGDESGSDSSSAPEDIEDSTYREPGAHKKRKLSKDVVPQPETLAAGPRKRGRPPGQTSKASKARLPSPAPKRGKKRPSDAAEASPAPSSNRPKSGKKVVPEESAADELNVIDQDPGSMLMLDPTPRVGGASRVFAYWTDKAYYPGFITEVLDGKAHIQFDDGTTANVSLDKLHRCELKIGDVVGLCNLPLNGKKKEPDIDWVVTQVPAGVTELRADHKVVLKATADPFRVAKHFVSNLRFRKKGVAALQDRKLQVDEEPLDEAAQDEPEDAAESSDELSSYRETTAGPSGTATSSKASKSTTATASKKHGPLFKGYGFVLSSNLTDPKATVKSKIIQHGGVYEEDIWSFYQKPDKRPIGGYRSIKLKESRKGLKGIFLLVSGAPKMTANLMMSLAIGVPVLSSQYVKDASTQSVAWQSYLASPGKSEYQMSYTSQFLIPNWGMDASVVSASLKKSWERRPFWDSKVMVVKPLDDIIAWTACAMGAESVEVVDKLTSETNTDDIDILIIGDDVEPPKQFKNFHGLVNKEYLKQCLIVSRKLPAKRYEKPDQK